MLGAPHTMVADGEGIAVPAHGNCVMLKMGPFQIFTAIFAMLFMIGTTSTSKSVSCLLGSLFN